MYLHNLTAAMAASIVLAVFSICEAQLTLFTDSPFQVVDNVGPLDLDAGIGRITVQDQPFPNTGGGLLFSGDIWWNQTATTGGKVSGYELVVTNATITNTSPATFELLGETTFASMTHPALTVFAYTFAELYVDGEHGPAPIIPSVPIQTFGMFTSDTGLYFNVLGNPPVSPNDTWVSSGAPQITCYDSRPAQVTAEPNPDLRLWVDQLVLGPHEWMAFQDSIGFSAIPWGDFDANGELDGGDANALVAEIAGDGGDLLFDMNNDGSVSIDDLDFWLMNAGAINLPSGNPYLYGDANLDGTVDVSDFNRWNGHKFEPLPEWSAGDFNADGAIDVSDFNLWNLNKFTSSDSVSLIPEPTAVCLLAMALIGLAGVVRARN